MSKIAVLAGDGIGPEIVAEALKVLRRLGLSLELEPAPVGGAGVEAADQPLPEPPRQIGHLPAQHQDRDAGDAATRLFQYVGVADRDGALVAIERKRAVVAARDEARHRAAVAWPEIRFQARQRRLSRIRCRQLQPLADVLRDARGKTFDRFFHGIRTVDSFGHRGCKLLRRFLRAEALDQSTPAGLVAHFADGSEAAARRLERVLWNDPASGVMRHADAGYPEAIACAREQGLDLPLLEVR